MKSCGAESAVNLNVDPERCVRLSHKQRRHVAVIVFHKKLSLFINICTGQSNVTIVMNISEGDTEREGEPHRIDKLINSHLERFPIDPTLLAGLG